MSETTFENAKVGGFLSEEFYKKYVTKKLEKRFQLKTKKSKKCWEWLGAINSDGYGNIRIHKRTVSAHRVAFFIKNRFIKGLVLHSCNNPGCVNPRHLSTGTQSDNMRHKILSGHCIHANKTECPRGHKYDKKNTRVYRGKRHCRTCDVIHRKNYRRAIK